MSSKSDEKDVQQAAQAQASEQDQNQAAVKIQALQRRAAAKKEVDRLRAERDDAKDNKSE